MIDDMNPYFVLQLMTLKQQQELAERLREKAPPKGYRCRASERWLRAIEDNLRVVTEKSARLN